MAEFPRSLTEIERAVLDFLLLPDFPGVHELRRQAQTATVVGLCDCGCPTFKLAVDERVARAVLSDVVPVEVRSTGDTDPDLLLFARHGRLESVELVWYGDEPPSEFPPLTSFETPEARRR